MSRKSILAYVRHATWLIILALLVWFLMQTTSLEYDSSMNGGCHVNDYPINEQCYNVTTDTYYDSGGRRE